MALSNETIVQLAVDAAHEKKARNVLILDIRELSMIADYFVICSGNSKTQVEAITEEISRQMKKQDVPMYGLEGQKEARWVLMNLGDVVVHVFHQEDREHYQLERLWADAQKVDVSAKVSQNS